MQKIEVRIKEGIDEHWSEWFDGLEIRHTEQNETVLSGCIADQAALYGLLIKLRDLDLSLVSLNVLPMPDRETAKELPPGPSRATEDTEPGCHFEPQGPTESVSHGPAV